MAPQTPQPSFDYDKSPDFSLWTLAKCQKAYHPRNHGHIRRLFERARQIVEQHDLSSQQQNGSKEQLKLKRNRWARKLSEEFGDIIQIKGHKDFAFWLCRGVLVYQAPYANLQAIKDGSKGKAKSSSSTAVAVLLEKPLSQTPAASAQNPLLPNELSRDDNAQAPTERGSRDHPIEIDRPAKKELEVSQTAIRPQAVYPDERFDFHIVCKRTAGQTTDKYLIPADDIGRHDTKGLPVKGLDYTKLCACLQQCFKLGRGAKLKLTYHMLESEDIVANIEDDVQLQNAVMYFTMRDRKYMMVEVEVLNEIARPPPPRTTDQVPDLDAVSSDELGHCQPIRRKRGRPTASLGKPI